jgi:hypothetical protein
MNERTGIVGSRTEGDPGIIKTQQVTRYKVQGTRHHDYTNIPVLTTHENMITETLWSKNQSRDLSLSLSVYSLQKRSRFQAAARHT